MKPLILTGCLVTGALAALFLQVPELRVLGWLAAAHAVVQAAGQLLIALGQRRLGAWIVLWGSLPIIPAGLLGAFGARGVLDELEVEEFQRHAERA